MANINALDGLSNAERAELVFALSALLCADASVDVSKENINAVIEASGNLASASQTATLSVASTKDDKDESALKAMEIISCSAPEGESEAKECANCSAPDGQNGFILKPCAKCELTWYCGRACQATHWKAGHKLLCLASRERKPLNLHSKSLDECPICLDPLAIGALCTLPCTHTFHAS